MLQKGKEDKGQISSFARVLGESNKPCSPFVGFRHVILRRAMEVLYEISSGNKSYAWLERGLFCRKVILSHATVTRKPRL